MAQPAEHTYFPPLEDCLRGQSIILSWKSVATALSDHTAELQTNPAVIDFLSHDLVQALLFDPASGFAPPTEQTRSSFETRTSAVNVPPSPDAKYDVATIRAHATWLSESANINLVVALRVVAIEFQSRPASHLAGPLSSQDAANLREAAGLKNGQDSVLILNLGAAASATADAETLWADFEAEDTVKSRIWATYLSERRHFAMTVDYVNSIRFYRRLPIGISAGPAAAAADLVAVYGLERPPDAGAVISAHLQLLRAVLLNVESGLEGTTRDPLLLTEDMAIEWSRTVLTEAAHLLSVIFHALDGLGRNFAPAAAAGDWFNLMSTYAFLAKLDPAREILRELVPPIQTLVGAISLAFISPFEALLSFEGERDEALSLDQSYLAASDVLEQIHQSILLATNTECESAAPAIFAWALVVTRMFASLNDRQEKRDSILHQNARETFEGSISDRPVPDRRRNSAGSIVSIEPTRFDHFLQETGLDKDMQVISGMANAVMANGKTFDVLTGMAQTAGSLAHTSLAPLLGYRIRIVCLAFLKACYPRVGYQADPVECLIAVLTKDHHHHQQPPPPQQQPQQHQQQQLQQLQQRCPDLLSPLPNIVNVALQDNLLLEFYLEQALTRFPYEFLPLIRLCRVLCSPSPGLPDRRSDIVLDLLRRTPTLTLILPAGFEQYEWETPSDDSSNEDPDTFSLVTDLVLISATSSWKRSRRITDANGDGDGDGAADDANHDVRIPAGTQGRFVTNSSPIVVMQFPHSALALLGRRLQVNLEKDSCDTRLPHLDTEEIGDAIGLIAELVNAEHAKEEAAAAASLSSQMSRPGAGAAAITATTAAAAVTAMINPERDVLAEASRYLGGSQDILSVVCDTMDRCMQDGLSASEDTDLGILHACIQFLHAALPRCPGRVFSYIARCDLLDSESRAGRLGMIVGNLDLVLERYDFLMSTVRLLSSMVDSVMASAVQRRCGGQFASRKRGEADGQLWIGIADRLLERVCYSMAQAVVDTFENSATWRFASDFDRISLLLAVIPVMNKMVVYTLGRDDSGSDALLACLRRAARHVTDSFLSPSAGSLRFQAILGTLASTFNYSIDSTLLPNKQRLLVSQLSVICDFTKHLLRETVYQNRASTTFETRLFMASALIARLGSVSTAFRRPTLELFEVLIRTTGRIKTEPPSLLGYLGTQISKSFLQTLARLDKPFNSGADLTALWRLFSSIVSSRQQWMSNCLLTGKTPREGLRNEQGAIEPSPDSVLVAVLGRAQALDEIDSREALAALEFVTAALNHWPRTIMVLERNRSFIDRLRGYVRGLRAPSVTTRTDPVRAAVEARLAAYVAQIWSMQLYHLRQMSRADDLAASLVADLDYYLRDGAPVSGYNKSLHVNFAKNFANKYPGCTLAAFKRSLLEPRELGVGFYYDLERADDMLRFDPGWTRGRGNNFRSEMELANANLSLVDAQLALFSAWRVLLLELGTCLRDAPGNIARQMLQVAQQCLVANQESQGPEAIFTSIADSRASLALMLVQKLTGTVLVPGEVNELLGNLFANLNRLDEPFSPVFISYTRILLKLIYVTLRAFTASQRLAAAQAGADGGGGGGSLIYLTQTILNLLDRVVARGFRTMVSFLHEPDTVISPGDMSLLTAILQASLCALPDADKCQTQILNIMASHDAARVAVSLFSWADKLTVDGGPVYGELSLLFLLELSSLPVVAEQLACDGVLANIMSANLIGYMRRNGGGPGMMTCSSSSSAAPENHNSNNSGSNTTTNNNNTNHNTSTNNNNNNKNSSISAINNAIAQRCYDIWAKGLLPLMLNFLTAMGAAIAPEVAYVLSQFPHLLRSSMDRFEAPGISRTSSIRDPSRYLTLLAVSEVHSLALLTRILAGLRANNTRDIPEVHWDAQAALENAEYWLATRRLLRERLIPTGPREADWAATPAGRRGEEGQAENMLEERAVAQLEAIRDVLAEEEDESE